MNKSFPKISLITPSFNQAAYLEECIKSVLDQNYLNLEYIVMDGGSTDGSVEIIKRYEPYITYWQSQPDGGQAAAIWDGFQRSTGTLLSWINSDDFLCKGALFRIAEAYQNNNSAGLIYGNGFWVDQKGDLICPLISHQMKYKHWIFGTTSVFQGSVFFTRHAYDTVGGINCGLVFAMEYELFFKIAKSFPTVHTNHFIACFRSQPDSKTSTIKKVGDSEIRKILLHLETLDTKGFKYKIISFLLKNYRRASITLPTRLFRNKNYSKIFKSIT